jgi:hypothetical protein
MFKSILFVMLTTMTLTVVHAGWGNGNGNWREVQASQTDGLTPLEAQNLLYLREEEKVARDIYDVMYDRWGLNIFNNISSAEQNHMDAVLVQLDRYGLVDPAQQPGVFSNQELQNLYDTLLINGSESELNALLTGALIEEVDIQDLNEMIEASDHWELINVYENLLCGSRNHLRAFVRQIESRGMVYEAQVLDQETVDQIVDSPMERRCGRG